MSIRSHLESMDDVVVVKERVDPRLEATAQMRAHPRTPVLFEDTGRGRLVVNLWASRARIARALRTDEHGLVALIATAQAHPKPPRRVKRADLLENEMTRVDLRRLPVPTFYEGDGGPYITAGIVVGEREYDGKLVRNVSFHRLMATGPRTAVARLVPRHLHKMHEDARAAKEDLPIAVAIGSCPPVLIAAASSVEFGHDELHIASALRRAARGRPVDVVRLPESGLTVPATAEIVLEGRLTRRVADEGPFVDITGTVDPVRRQPVVVFDRMYHRDDPIFHAILPGGHEHYMMMGLPKEPGILRSVRGVVPDVRAVRLTEGGCCWLHGVVSIKVRNHGDAKNAMLAAFAGHASMKRVVVVDEDIDPFDDEQVEWALATRFQADRDILVIEGARGSSLDPSSDGTTAKLGLDATVPLGKDRAPFVRVR